MSTIRQRPFNAETLFEYLQLIDIQASRLPVSNPATAVNYRCGNGLI